MLQFFIILPDLVGGFTMMLWMRYPSMFAEHSTLRLQQQRQSQKPATTRLSQSVRDLADEKMFLLAESHRVN